MTTKQQLKEQKKFADEYWDRVMTNTSNGIINREEIGKAMELVNEVDRRIIEHERLEMLD